VQEILVGNFLSTLPGPQGTGCPLFLDELLERMYLLLYRTESKHLETLIPFDMP
jgi:hypothetical protein